MNIKGEIRSLEGGVSSQSQSQSRRNRSTPRKRVTVKSNCDDMTRVEGVEGMVEMMRRERKGVGRTKDQEIRCVESSPAGSPVQCSAVSAVL